MRVRVEVRMRVGVGVRIRVGVRVRARARVRSVGHRRRQSSWKAWLQGVTSHRWPCSHASWQMEHAWQG